MKQPKKKKNIIVNNYQMGGDIDFYENPQYLLMNGPYIPKPKRPLVYPAQKSKLKVNDTRKLNATSGQKINPKKDLVNGLYDTEHINNLIRYGKLYGVDPYDLLAIDLQETVLGNSTKGGSENIGHNTLRSDQLKTPSKFNSENLEGYDEQYDNFTRAYLDKLNTAKRLGLKKEEDILQVYNGTGNVYPSTEADYHGYNMSSIYGVPLPKSGISLKQNPLYGKRIKDLKNNVLKNSPEIREAVETVYQQGGTVPLLPVSKPVIKLGADNTRVKNSVLPTSNNKRDVELSKKKVSINKLAQRKDAYYHPKVVKGISSGDEAIDFVYNNQWLMDLPLVGDIIKEKAYDIASSNSGMGMVDTKAKKPGKEGEGYYDGTLPSNGSVPEQVNPAKLLDVYFGKAKLPNSKYKPKDDYLEFLPSYSIKDNVNKSGYKNLPKILESLGVTDSTDFRKPIYSKQHVDERDKLSNFLGSDLGHYKTGIAFDEDRKLPYLSVSDAWDFEPESYQKLWSMDNNKERSDRTYIQSSLMHKAGQPFKVYDRFYFDPKTKAYIPDEEPKRRSRVDYKKDGGSIHINPANKGKFTASAKAAGMGVQEFAAHVLANKEDYSSTQVKRANFARNATKFNHQMGGMVDMPNINSVKDNVSYKAPYILPPSVKETDVLKQYISQEKDPAKVEALKKSILKYGNPSIEYGYIPGGYGGFTNIFGNGITINRDHKTSQELQDIILSELAHKKKAENGIIPTIVQMAKDIPVYMKGLGEPYKTKNTMEHEVHSIIEPELIKEYNANYSSNRMQTKYPDLMKKLNPGVMSKIKKKNGGSVSTQGYKADSPDRFNEYNIIPSGNITMDNVDFPVFGVDNLGNQQMMFPGQDYNFPGNSVTEYPMKKRNGGVVSNGNKLAKFLESFNTFHVTNSPTVDMFDPTIFAQMGTEVPNPYDQGITPFYDYNPGFVPPETTNPVVNNQPTKPKSNKLSISDYLKNQGANKIMNRATSNLMGDFVDPSSLYNTLGTVEAGVNYLGNQSRNRRQQDWLNDQRNSDQLFGVQPGGDRGEYVTTGSAYGQFRPDQLGAKSPYGMQGMYYPSMQMGGVYTENPRDPRIRNYKDSLNLYKESVKASQIAKSGARIDNDPNRGFDWPTVRAFDNQKAKEQQFIDRLTKLNKKVPTGKNYNIKGGTNSIDDLYGTIYKKPTTPVTYRRPEYEPIPGDLDWTTIEQPAPVSNITYPFGKRGEVMTQAEWDYSRKKRGYPDVYSDRVQGTDNFIPGEIFSNEVRNDVMEFRKKNKMEYGGQNPGNGYALQLNNGIRKMASPEGDSPISKTLQPVDEEFANIEAELGETIFGDFDNDGINEHMKVGGKKHSQGGTPLAVPGGAFVFSDTKKMKIGGEILESFGKNKDTKKVYTPAELAKQYDINKYKEILDNNKDVDPIVTRTAEMMIENYNNKLGKLALVQEGKKGFPNGVPQIAIPYLMGEVAPPGLENTNEPNNDQMFAIGGEVYNPWENYDPATGLPIDPYKGGRTAAGTTTPTGKQNPYNRKSDHLSAWENIIPGIRNMKNSDAQSAMYDYNLKNNPNSIKEMWSTYGLTAKGLKDKELAKLANKGVLTPDVLTPDNLNRLKSAYADNYFGVRQMDPVAPNVPQLPGIPTRTINPTPPTATPSFRTPEELAPNPFTPGVSRPQDPTDFWTQDKLNSIYALQNKANLAKYLPWAAPVIATTADPTFYDPNRELASNAEQMNTEMMYNAQFSGPQSLGARNSAVAGSAASNAANILSKYNNMNVGVANEYSGANAAIMNQLNAAQAARANNLYQGNVIANQQYDNSRAQANDVIRRNLVGALDNQQKTGWINSWYPQFDIDPGSGSIGFQPGSGRSTITPGGGAARTYLDVFKQLKRENPNVPDEVLREQAKQMTGTATNTITSEGDLKSVYKGPTPQQLMQMLKGQ